MPLAEKEKEKRVSPRKCEQTRGSEMAKNARLSVVMCIFLIITAT